MTPPPLTAAKGFAVAARTSSSSSSKCYSSESDSSWLQFQLDNALPQAMQLACPQQQWQQHQSVVTWQGQLIHS
jgi:hypothetical protein